MGDLAAFLKARLTEDEAAAQSQAAWLREYEKRPGDWSRFMSDPVIGPFGGQSPLRSIDRGLYVGRVADPDRLLREVAAKRAILAEHAPYVLDGSPSHCKRCQRDWPCVTVGAVAAVYSDHPDYDPAWGVSTGR